MRVSGAQGHPPPFMVCRFHGKRCLEVSKEKWKVPGKRNLPAREVREALEQGVGTSRNKDSRLCTHLQGCRLGAQLGREDTEEQDH